MNIPEDVILFCCDFETTGLDPINDYPIELGGLFLNHKLDIIESYDSLISWPDLINLDQIDWPEQYQRAYEFHKIPLSELRQKGKDPMTVVANLSKISGRLSLSNEPYHKNKIVILSDNAQFEYNFMKRLFKQDCESPASWPFHYCAWDTSLLLEMTGIGDPKDVPHRAYQDACQLYKNIILSTTRIKS